MAENRYKKDIPSPKESLWGKLSKGFNTSKKESSGEKVSKAKGASKPLVSLSSPEPMSLVPKFLFIALLGVLYVANTHYTEKVVRASSSLKKEVEKLRVDYTTLKYEYIKVSQQGELKQRAQKIGLIPNNKPVAKIKSNDKP